jgi:hypothetical protein
MLPCFSFLWNWFCSNLARIFGSRVKSLEMKSERVTSCTRRCFGSFTLCYGHVLDSQREGVSPKGKCPVEKTPNLAGGPQFVGLEPPKKLSGSLPPSTVNRDEGHAAFIIRGSLMSLRI